MRTARPYKAIVVACCITLVCLVLIPQQVGAVATMQDYCVAPPFVMQPVPPLVLLAMGRDHKIYYEAFNDAYDLDGDGRLDIHYKHSIDYYGYFDPNRCYTYSSTGSRGFVPVTSSISTDKFCSAGEWSGNVLNYLTMSKMDIIRKVFYGGYRSADSSSSTVLERTYIPQDAHSWGKEFTGRLCYDGSTYTNQCITDVDCDPGGTCTDKSVNLIGIAASAAPVTCTPNAVASPWDRNGQLLLAKYRHDAAKTATADAVDHATLVSSYEPVNILSLTYVADFNNAALDPNVNHDRSYNYFLVTEFEVTAATAGTWSFAVDSNEAAEVEIDGAVVASWYNKHNYCNCQTHTGTIPLAVGWHRMIVRHFEDDDVGNTSAKKDGVKVYYDLPGGAVTWNVFGSSLNLRAPDIDPANTGNYCSIQTPGFIATGDPDTLGFTSGVPKQHLFCNTSLGSGSADAPLLRMLTDRAERVWTWASKERPVCDNSLGAPTDFEVRVTVCDSTESGGGNPALQTPYFKSYCQPYGSNWKPRGLLQKYSEGDGTKVCSIQFTKQCNTNSDCSSGEGECVAKAKMMFGLISGSYTKHMSGGVLRKNIGNFLDEINSSAGNFQTSENVRGNIAMTLDRMKIIGFNYGGYQYGCGWITNGAMTEGTCKDWGNPVAEMLYEAERYFAGKTLTTESFMYSTNDDSGLNLSKQGCPPSNSSCNKPWIAPYSLYPTCSRPFILTFSDVSPSYDSDSVPGSAFNSFTGDLTGLNVSTLADTIGTAEGIAGTSRYIGQSGTGAGSTDFLCTSKSVSNLSSVRGLCPEEPTKQGSFYSAAVSYYGKDKLKICSNNQAQVCSVDADCASGGKCTKRNINTYSVALSSPVPDLGFKIAGRKISFIPTAKSVDGCFSVNTNCNCTFTRDANGLHMSNCSGFCPTNQIVDFYVDKVTYDASGNLTYARFRINFEDVEQGADHDMDAIVAYEVAPDTLDPTKLTISLTSEYAAGCIDQAMGFIITGTTEDGVYLPVRDVDGTTSTRSGPLPLNWTKTFTLTGTSVSSTKDPLWYAAKWGGFDDINNNSIPDLQAEWDKDGNGVPDNYFLVVNPQRMEQQIEDAFLSILRRASSGTAASVLASGEGSGANLVQAIFYPKRMFDKEIDWTGTLQNLWYYLDPRLGSSTIREDTTDDNQLKLDQDYIVNMFFDTAEQRTKALRWSDSNGDGIPETQENTVYLEELKYLWESGSQLHARTSADPRTIYTNYNNTLTNFSTGLAADATFRTLIQAADATAATNIINYVRGDSDGSGNRNRTVTNPDTGVAGIWKLGDIVNSTPKIVSWIPLNQYDRTYADTTYANFLKSKTTTYYQNRGKVDSDHATYHGSGYVFTGANDGMLHAFKLGALDVVRDGSTKKAALLGTELGKEAWAFIPRNSLPYLKYLMDPGYCHLYYVDMTPYVFDASISIPSTCTATNYWECTREETSWRTILIGGMRLGGACKNANYTAAFSGDPFVKTPITTAGYTEVGYSSYFALDVTDPSAPALMWEFSNPNLGYSTTGPSIIRINSREVPVSTPTVSIANKKKNGKWYVVLASGPTGSIDTDRQFKGYSDQPLRLFVLDAKTGSLMRTINTADAAVPAADQINYAFGGTLTNANVDYDFDYQDDVLYLGYTKSEDAVPSSTTRWTNGGVIRLVTREDQNGTNLDPAAGNTALNPNTWAWSHVIKDTGSVTAAVAHMAHYRSGSTKPDLAWLYFGTGRFYYRGDDATARKIGGVKDLCLRDVSASVMPIGLSADPASQFYAECTNGSTTPPLAAQVLTSDLTDKTCDGLTGSALDACVKQPCVSAGVPMVGSQLVQCLSDRSYKGWYISLDSPPAERVITDPLATPTGVVFYTTFAPSPDICKFGGTSYLWAVNYETGGGVGSALSGKGLLQVSTGAIEEIDLKTAFTEEGGRRTTAIDGVPPTGQGLAVVVPPKPVGKIMHIRKE